jgi:hypothetical protein
MPPETLMAMMPTTFHWRMGLRALTHTDHCRRDELEVLAVERSEEITAVEEDERIAHNGVAVHKYVLDHDRHVTHLALPRLGETAEEKSKRP